MRIAALDIGGTSIKSGIWTGDGLCEISEQDTCAKQGGLFVMNRAKEILHQYKDIQAVGISTAGQVNADEGSIRYANENIPGYTGMQVQKIMEEEFGVPVAVENDVNAAAVGEGRFGAGREEEDFLCITYGTGVGGAIVIGKEIYHGACFSAGEFGAILLHPEDRVDGDPFSGCYEKYASTTALVNRAKTLDETLINGRKIFERIDEPEVKAVIDSWINEIVCGLVTVTHMFNPSCIILGGGIMAQNYVIEQVRERTLHHIMTSFANVQICQAELGNQAGLLGAAYLAHCAWKKLNH